MCKSKVTHFYYYTIKRQSQIHYCSLRKTLDRSRYKFFVVDGVLTDEFWSECTSNISSIPGVYPLFDQYHPSIMVSYVSFSMKSSLTIAFQIEE